MVVFRYSGNWRSYLEGSSSTVSQDKVGNTSVVKVDVWIGMDAGWSIEFGNTYGNVVNVTCDGQTKTITVGALSLNGSKKYLGSVQFTVTHNPEGVKEAGISLSSNMSNVTYGSLVFGNASGSWSHTLPTIYRASSVASVSGTIGSPVTINITRQATSFTHTVRYAFGDKSGTIATGVGTSATWTIPMDFCNNLPSATSGTGTIYVDTYSGSTKIGTASNTLTASVPTSVVPTFTGITLTDANTAVQALITDNNFLQIMSNIQVTFNGESGSYSSSITGYKAEIVGKNQATNSNGGTLGIMNFNGSATIRASVVDSRGRWSDTKDVTINVIEYFAPILSFTALRTRETPSIIQIVRNAMIAPITLSGSQKNIMTLSFKVAPLGSTSYTADNGSASGSWTTQSALTNSPANMAGNYPANKSFTVVGTLSDKFTSVEFSTTVSTEAVVMSYDKDGRMAIGKIADTTLPVGSFEAVGNIYAGGKQIQHHQLTQNGGGALELKSTDDWNAITTAGFYMGYNLPNQPTNPGMHGWKYVRVTRHNDSYVLQEAIDFFGIASTFRVKINGTWSSWKEYATTDHPMLQEKPLKTITQGMPYGLNATLTRKDNLVTITLNRGIANIEVFEYREAVETIPLGYRPTAETHMVIVPNSGQLTIVPSILHFATDGKIRFTNGTAGQKVWTGTLTYITNNSYPT